MLKNNIFNTEYEMELRLLMVLYHSGYDFLNEEQLFCYDFIICYGKIYGVSDFNLHGDSQYKYGEIATRKALIHDAVIKLVLKGFVNPIVNNGFNYEISDSGINFLDSLNNGYSSCYQETAKLSFDKYDLDIDGAKLFIKSLTTKGGITNVKN